MSTKARRRAPSAKSSTVYPLAQSLRAARRFVDSSALAVAYKLAEDACAAIKGKEVDFAVPPIESSTFANYDLLSKYSLHIVNEYDLLQQEQEASPVQDASSYTRSLPLFKTELGLDDKKTAAIDFKTSLVFGSKDSTVRGMLAVFLAVPGPDQD
ncbi:hypothetical protein PF006_g23903 [Phytophthora fragariae]|uniref:Uncharacterized protein n=1 Tax=Phytophthora fragariae TaxID=53985 RepID=A0A6A3REU8_9STRA|nr:hypothetical protein PF006_g23903 [Phytophthora fragariae]